MSAIDWSKFKDERILGRLPNKDRVINHELGKKSWEEAIKPESGLPDRNVGQSQTETLDKSEFKKGALEPDVFYAGLEEEIERVAKLMADVE